MMLARGRQRRRWLRALQPATLDHTIDVLVREAAYRPLGAHEEQALARLRAERERRAAAGAREVTR